MNDHALDVSKGYGDRTTAAFVPRPRGIEDRGEPSAPPFFPPRHPPPHPLELARRGVRDGRRLEVKPAIARVQAYMMAPTQDGASRKTR